MPEPALGIRAIHHRVEDHFHLVVERTCRRVLEGTLGKIRQACTPVQCRQCQHEAHRKFGLMDGLRIGYRAQHVDGTLMHMRGHRRNVVVLQLIVLHHFQQRVSRGVGMTAGSVKLERGFGHAPACAETINQLCGIGIGGHARRHALFSFKNFVRAGKAITGDIGSHQAVSRRFGRMQLLGISRIAQELPQTRRHGARRADAVLHLLRIEFEDVRHACRCCKLARSAGGVKHLVVRTTEKLTDSHAALVTRHGCRDQILARSTHFLSGRQHRREHNRGRVIDGAVMHIILLHHVRSRTVDQRGEKRRGAAARGQYFRRACGGPHGLGKLLQHQNGTRALACQTRAKPVEKKIFSARYHIQRQRFVTYRRQKLAQGLRFAFGGREGVVFGLIHDKCSLVMRQL